MAYGAFYVRVWLCGLGACGVFAPRFISLPLLSQFVSVTFWFGLSLSFYSLFLLTFLAYFFACLGCWLSFPFGRLQTKKRAQRFAPCVLACPVGCVVVILLPRFCLLLLCIPFLRHCKPVQSVYTIRCRCHRSKQM